MQNIFDNIDNSRPVDAPRPLRPSMPLSSGSVINHDNAYLLFRIQSLRRRLTEMIHLYLELLKMSSSSYQFASAQLHEKEFQMNHEAGLAQQIKTDETIT